MYLHFNKEGKLKTSINHGEPIRQGSTLRITVCFDVDDFKEFADKTVNMKIIGVDGKTTYNILVGHEEIRTFIKASNSELTYTLIPGKKYYMFDFVYDVNEEYGYPTVNAGKIAAIVSIVEPRENGSDLVLVQGRADLFVEKTFGMAQSTTIDSISHYEELKSDINTLNTKKQDKELSYETKESIDNKMSTVEGSIVHFYNEIEPLKENVNNLLDRVYYEFIVNKITGAKKHTLLLSLAEFNAIKEKFNDNYDVDIKNPEKTIVQKVLGYRKINETETLVTSHNQGAYNVIYQKHLISGNITITDYNNDIDERYEENRNKVSSIVGKENNAFYPTTKAVADFVDSKISLYTVEKTSDSYLYNEKSKEFEELILPKPLHINDVISDFSSGKTVRLKIEDKVYLVIAVNRNKNTITISDPNGYLVVLDQSGKIYPLLSNELKENLNIPITSGAVYKELNAQTNEIKNQIKEEITDKIGTPNGIATLNENGTLNSSQLPSYVDDVLEFETKDAFPEIGEKGKIYIDMSTNFSYRWTGSIYSRIKSGDIVVSDGSSTAFSAAEGSVLKDKIDQIEPLAHSHNNKELLDSLEEYQENIIEGYPAKEIGFDKEPTQGSENIVLSGNIYNAIEKAKQESEDLSKYIVTITEGVGSNVIIKNGPEPEGDYDYIIPKLTSADIQNIIFSLKLGKTCYIKYINDAVSHGTEFVYLVIGSYSNSSIIVEYGSEGGGFQGKLLYDIEGENKEDKGFCQGFLDTILYRAIEYQETKIGNVPKLDKWTVVGIADSLMSGRNITIIIFNTEPGNDRRDICAVNSGGKIDENGILGYYFSLTYRGYEVTYKTYGEGEMISEPVIEIEDTGWGIDTTSASPITLADNTSFRLGEITTLTINNADSYPLDFMCEVVFTSGTGFSMDYSALAITFSGDDCNGGVFTPSDTKTYNILFFNNSNNETASLQAIVRGV